MTGNKVEFRDVYEKFHARIRSYLVRMVGENEAEDLAQEVFVKISNGLNEFKGDSGLSTWIYRIATDAALDKIRSRAFRESKDKVSLNAATEKIEGEDTDTLVSETSFTAEREAVRNEMNECIREFVDRLPEDFRTVIILSEIEDLKNREIADILELSLDAVKIRLHRARARLKAEFEAG